MLQYYIITMAIGTLFAQEIKLYKFGHNDCSSVCNSGMLTTLDYCFFTSIVILNGSLPEHTLVYFEISELSFPHIFSLDIPTECKGFIKNADHYCSQMGNNTFNITIMVKSLSTVRDAELRGYIRTSNGSKIYSEVQRIPKMHRQNDAKGILKINGRKMTNESNCSTTTHTNELALEFMCLDHPESCVIDLLINGSVVISQSRKHASYRATYEHEYDILVVVKYSACNIDGQINTLQCDVKREILIDTSRSSLDLSVYYAVPFVAFFFLMGAVLLMIYRIKRKRIINSTDVSESDIEQTEVDVFLRRKTGSNLGSPACDNSDHLMDELTSEIESRIQSGEFNSKFDGLIEGYGGFLILLNAINNGNTKVAKYLMTDASSFINDFESYRQVCESVYKSRNPDLIAQLKATQLCYKTKIDNFTNQNTNDIPIPL